ncbi:O-antigen ligase family protein [Propionispora hippei]|uniref:O-antigen ligase n=1 Tax=Propionispora hippei DSM 15287 TaxID=1123003 RepID=A0A1M6K3I0_9FIRM|nr:O-antigen ligase family protein [Propionispora hippei]SHJ53442.1 O-antigen ligase [Propionispora hippei DSM 15287]
MITSFSKEKLFWYSLCAFAFFTPIGKAPANLFFGLSVITCVILLAEYKMSIGQFVQQPLVKPLGVLFLTIFLTLPFSTDVHSSYQEYPRMIVYVLPFFLFAAVQSCRVRGKEVPTETILNSYIAGAVTASFYAIYQFIKTKHLYVTGLYMHHVMFGVFLEIALPIISAFLIETLSFSKRLIYLFCAFICSIALILTQARGDWIGTGVALLAVAFMLRDRLRQHKRKVVAGVIIAFILIGAMAPLYITRVKTLFDPNWQSNYVRIYIWQSSINMIRDYPLTGVGFDQFREIYNARYINPLSPEKSNPHAHNSFLMMAAETGLPSLAAFLYLLFHMYKELITVWRKTHKGYHAAILALLIAITVSSLVDHIFWAPFLAKILWFFMGVSLFFDNEHGL